MHYVRIKHGVPYKVDPERWGWWTRLTPSDDWRLWVAWRRLKDECYFMLGPVHGKPDGLFRLVTSIETEECVPGNYWLNDYERVRTYLEHWSVNPSTDEMTEPLPVTYVR
jgi:hypothetical protein